MYNTNSSFEKAHIINLGKLSYDVSNQSLSSNKETIYLRNKLNGVLSYMVSNPQRCVSRDELIQKIWDGNIYTGVKAVTHSVCKLRKTFIELGEKEISIRTLPKRGYALIIHQTD